jgi:hypothetical protein
MIDREGADHPAWPDVDRRRPAGAQIVRSGQFAEIGPERIGLGVGHIDRVPQIGRRAARSPVGADLLSVDGVAERLGKAGRGAVQQAAPLVVEQQDRGQQIAASRRLDGQQVTVEDLFQAVAGGAFGLGVQVALVESHAEQV